MPPAEITAAQLSSLHPDGSPVLVVLAKRTYTVDEAGRCTPAPEQPGLLEAPVWDPERPDLLLADTDMFLHKLRTDVVVQGHVHGDGQAGSLRAGVVVAGRRKPLLVHGERRCTIGYNGEVVFSEPTAIERVPLRYTHAYGGRDAVHEAKYGNPLRGDPDCRGMSPEEIDAGSPYLYPRNPCGRGYLIQVTRAAVEALELPQIEVPDDPLRPRRLAVGSADRWSRMPLPAGTDWVDYAWYPRIAFLGVVPACERFTEPPAEVTLGLVPPELAAGDGVKPPGSEFELGSGASLGLQLPLLRGGEPVELEHIHPRRTAWRTAVPPPPALAIDGRKGKLVAVEPVLHTLVLEPDRGRVTVVWRGQGPATRRHAPDELRRMPMRADWRE